MSSPQPHPQDTSSRRQFLQQAAGLTAGIAAAPAIAQASNSDSLLPMIK